MQVTPVVTNNYAYDDANRLTSVDGVPYTWDSNGKMQSAAYPLLTQAASANSGAAGGLPLSQYINPVVCSTARPNGDVIHKLQYGQSLWSIAIAYYTTINQIRLWNNLGEDTTVYEGQVLLVQRFATQPPPATSTPLASPTATPVITHTPVQPTATPTMTVQPSPNSPGEDEPSDNPSTSIRVGLILAIVALGGLIAALLMQGTN